MANSKKRLKCLYLLCGIPGSGKSTWAKQRVAEGCIWCSRDEIRFSLLQEGEDYFSHEDEVIHLWYKKINEALAAGHDVIVDATHLSAKARKNTLHHLNLKDVGVVPVYFNIPLETCLERNAKREGRARVPDSVIKNMSNGLTAPTEAEYKYKMILEVTT